MPMPQMPNLFEVVTQFQPEGSPLENVKDPCGRVDVLASKLVQELAVRYRGNPAVALGAQLLKPSIDRAIAAMLPSKPLAFIKGTPNRKPRARKRVIR